MSLLRRALAGATIVASLAATLGAAPASAADSGVCDYYRSRRLLTANNGEYKVWVDQFTDIYGRDTTNVCWKSSSTSAGVLTFRSPFRDSPLPTVNYVVNDPSCPNFFTVEDPVQAVVELSAGIYGNPADICFGVGDNRAVRVRLGTPTIGNVSTELWLDKGTVVARTYCAGLALAGFSDYDCYSSSSAIRVI